MKWLSKLRLSWVLMIVVVVISLVGANKIMHGPNDKRPVPARQPVEKAEKAAARAVPTAVGTVATGIVTPEGDIVPLVPSMKGEVVEVRVKADQEVKKGELLLRMDDRQAKIKFARANTAVKAAELLKLKAQNGVRQWELRKQIQLKTIEARKQDQASVERIAARYKEMKEKRMNLGAEADYEAARFKAEAAASAVRAEEYALDLIDISKPTTEIEQADLGIIDAKDQLREATLGLEICELRAPADGTIMQSFVSVGFKFGEQLVRPAFYFYTGGLIVKADIQQEFAGRAKVGMAVVIEDYAPSGQNWKGRVTYIARAYLPSKREIAELTSLLPQSSEPVLECRIALDPTENPPFLNQKVRVRIGQ